MRHTSGLAQTPARLDSDDAIDACKSEADPSFEHIDKMSCHVVPVPTGFFCKRCDGADVFCTNSPPRGVIEAEITVFAVCSRSISGEIGFIKREQVELAQGLGGIERPFIVRR